MSQPRWQPESPEAVVKALEEAGSIKRAARSLGVGTDGLRRWCEENHLDISPYRSRGGREAYRIEVSQEIIDKLDHSRGMAGMAEQLECDVRTLRASCEKAGIDLSPYKSKGGRKREAEVDVEPDVAHAHNVEIQRLKTKLSTAEGLYKAACKEESLHADLRDIAREQWQPYKPPRIVVVKPHDAKIVEDAILSWADWHGGETVDYDVMQGYNAYNLAIMCRRAQYTVDTTVDCLFSWHSGTRFERLWVFDLGDSINGELRDEQKATNEVGWCQSVRIVAHIRARALQELSSYLPVCYVAVPGNHARLGKHMEWKRPTENGDWLVAEMVGDLCRGNDRIQCVSPESWTTMVTTRGWHHSLNHGTTAAKGSYGGISWYAIQRADGKLTALESAHGKHINYRWFGHIHQRSELPAMDGEGEVFINGSLKGGDEYALYGLNAYSAPRQTLVGVHDDTGVSWRYPLLVQRSDQKPSRYEDLIA